MSVQLQHFLTLDRGAGPISFIRVIQEGENEAMLRIIHKARFDRTANIDPASAAEIVKTVGNLVYASGDLLPEHTELIDEELKRTLAHILPSSTIRWRHNDAVFFNSESDAEALFEPPPPAPVQRRTIMG